MGDWVPKVNDILNGPLGFLTGLDLKAHPGDLEIHEMDQRTQQSSHPFLYNDIATHLAFLSDYSTSR